MSGVIRKSLNAPDEIETFPLGVSQEVHLGELTVGRNVHQPGWHWAEHVRPIVGGTSCRVHHTGVVLRGRLRFRTDSGVEVEFNAGDVFDVPPGHDAWVVGDEEYETIDWVGAHRWASPPTGERILATLVFTDMVESTALAHRLGDHRWTRLVEDHNTRLRIVLDRFRGREVDTTGDGLFAVFDGAERAVRAAAAMHDAVEPLGIEIRASVHTGEIESLPGNVRGAAVHVGARLLSLATAGEVLVSATTRDLLAADDLSFVDRGVHELKGVSGPRQVFRLERPPPAAR